MMHAVTPDARKPPARVPLARIVAIEAANNETK
jgi:hypothetical protein